MGLISACDIRISASSASFGIKQTDLDDTLFLRLLPKLVGNSSWIFDVSLSGREFDASEALRVGFVTRVVDGDDEALREGLRLAEIIAARSPIFMQKSKQALWRVRNIRASKHLVFCMTLRDSSKSGMELIQESNQHRNGLMDILRLNWRLTWIKLLGWELRGTWPRVKSCSIVSKAMINSTSRFMFS